MKDILDIETTALDDGLDVLSDLGGKLKDDF